MPVYLVVRKSIRGLSLSFEPAKVTVVSVTTQLVAQEPEREFGLLGDDAVPEESEEVDPVRVSHHHPISHATNLQLRKAHYCLL